MIELIPAKDRAKHKCISCGCGLVQYMAEFIETAGVVKHPLCSKCALAYNLAYSLELPEDKINGQRNRTRVLQNNYEGN